MAPAARRGHSGSDGRLRDVSSWNDGLQADLEAHPSTSYAIARDLQTQQAARQGLARGAALAAALQELNFTDLALAFTARKDSDTLQPSLSLTDASSKRYRYRESLYMIEPHGKFMNAWNVYLLFLMLFTAFITPYEVAFLESTPADAFYWVVRSVDISFFVDLLINFNLILYDEETQKYVSKRSEIVTRYLRTHFALDLISIFPFDEVVIASARSSRENYQALRIIRLIRLIKLLRVIRMSRIFARFESKITIRYGVLKLWRNMLSVLLVCHWMACMFHLLAVLERNPCNWIHAYFGGSSCVAPHVYPNNVERYVAALYLATYTVATVGYGDVPVTNLGERLFLIFGMIIGAALFAYVVGNICDVLLSLSVRHNEFQALMDTANAFITESHLSPELSDRVRTFLRNRRVARSEQEVSDFMRNLSPALRADVALELNKDRLTNVEFFRGAPKEMLVQISFMLHPEVYPPLETVIAPTELADRMYIIKNGLLAVSGLVRGKGLVVGEDMVFKTGMRGYKVATIKFAELLMLRKTDLNSVLVDFPGPAAHIRAKVIRVIFKEKIMQFGHICKRVQASATRMLLPPSNDRGGRITRSASSGSLSGGADVASVATTAMAGKVRALLRDTRMLEGGCAFPVALLAVSLSNPKFEVLLTSVATRIQRAWRAWLHRRQVRHLAAQANAQRRAEAEAVRRAADEERERERDAAPVLGLLGNERVVLVYGPAPLAAEQLRRAVDDLRAQVALLQAQVAAMAGLGAPQPQRKGRTLGDRDRFAEPEQNERHGRRASIPRRETF